MTYRTSRQVTVRFQGYDVVIPTGTGLLKLKDGRGGDCYAIDNAKALGVNDHDATHYYVWVPADCVEVV